LQSRASGIQKFGKNIDSEIKFDNICDELEVAAGKKVGNVVRKFTQAEIDEYVRLATKNGDKNKVMLGMWDNGRETSYVNRAGNEYTYFNMGDKWSEAENLVNKNKSEMWKINKQFIDEQHKAKKEFWFSHDPYSPKTDQFFSDEVSYLID
jgi:hypothetical protein